MDIDPLQDAPPARYAVESDSEDEIGHYIGPRSTRMVHTYKIESNPPTGDHDSLIVICGPAGRYWLTGLDGQSIGSIHLDGIQVVEYWITNSKQLVAVLTHRLPLASHHVVARSIIETQSAKKPILLFDSYSYLAYISGQSYIQDDQPVRYLSTSTGTQSLPNAIIPFVPPNLVQHLAAAIMAECEYLQIQATVLLMPTRHMPAPAPPKPTAYSTSDYLPPTLASLEAVTQAVLSTFDVTLDQLGWKTSRVGQRSTALGAQSRARNLDIGEGSMYI